MRMGFLGFGRVPYPDKDGRYRYGVDPLSAVESVSELGCIQYVSASQPMRASMDSARYYSDVADAYAGTKLPQPYTGKGLSWV